MKETASGNLKGNREGSMHTFTFESLLARDPQLILRGQHYILVI
jgi:hypothetical protein